MATGVLPICLGRGTKLAGYILAANKSYEGRAELGRTTDTLDITGCVTGENIAAAERVGPEQLSAQASCLVGIQEQVPPMFSAVKQGGKRLYQLARRGQVIDRPSRPVEITRFHVSFCGPRQIEFSVDCSKGTYVRSLIANLGDLLGCGAMLTTLRRTRCGRFSLQQAVNVSSFSDKYWEDRLIPLEGMISDIPVVPVPARFVSWVQNGRQLPWKALSPTEAPPGGVFQLWGPSGRLLALSRLQRGELQFLRVFTYTLT